MIRKNLNLCRETLTGEKPHGPGAQKRPRGLVLISSLSAVVLIIAATALLWNSSSAFAAANCTQLVTSRCEKCHYKTRICEKIQKRQGKGSWKRTIKNMVRHGAQLNAAEQKQLAYCLSTPTPDVLKLCELDK
ncbi:hypothetical protein MNBD_DELTA04-561 [hydrothermal vent metagenome]|uniref:Uncharacterized protein n=1 Tax=hydrothermal vent metagenome TaxID=652676 RepID=A0A3B0VB06_9ZZZZ